jgi:hypothetical protein
MPKYLDFVKQIFWLGGWAIIKGFTNDCIAHVYANFQSVRHCQQNIPFTHAHILFPPTPRKSTPLKKGNSEMTKSVQDILATPIRFQ